MHRREAGEVDEYDCEEAKHDSQIIDFVGWGFAANSASEGDGGRERLVYVHVRTLTYTWTNVSASWGYWVEAAFPDPRVPNSCPQGPKFGTVFIDPTQLHSRILSALNGSLIHRGC